MTESRRFLQIGLLVAVAIMLVIGAKRVKKRRTLVTATVDDIEAQLAALDPATRTAVIARLTVDAEQAARAKHGQS